MILMMNGALDVVGEVFGMRFRRCTDERVERRGRTSARTSAAAIFFLKLFELMLQQTDGFDQRGQVDRRILLSFRGASREIGEEGMRGRGRGRKEGCGRGNGEGKRA